MAAALTLPAIAEDAKVKIEPGSGPTSTMTDQVPQMKSDAEAVKQAGPNSATLLPASKAAGEAVPSMRPGDAVSGQADSKSSPAAPTAETVVPQGPRLTLTDEDSKIWTNKPIYSSDGKNVGEVAAFQRDADNNVIGMHADIGGIFGMGETRVNVAPSQFKLYGDRILLDLTAAQAKELPKVQS
jgi:hypothetical protein